MGTLKLWSGQDALTELPRKGAEITSLKEEGAARKATPRSLRRQPRKGKCQDDTFWKGLCKDELQGSLLNGFQSWMTIKTGGLETIPGKFKPRKRLAGKAVSRMDTQEIFPVIRKLPRQERQFETGRSAKESVQDEVGDRLRDASLWVKGIPNSWTTAASGWANMEDECQEATRRLKGIEQTPGWL
ncbi:hypothetical protein ACOI2Q_06555 [Shewanella algae]|uniref:hypothetical protein n=1 Tax=Shewanella algae TaxID=38313 RepID=UPI00300599FB